MESENKLNKAIKDKTLITSKVQNLLSDDIRNAKINFDYNFLEGLEECEKQELSKCEKSLLFQGKQMGIMTFEIGKALYKAKDILKKSQSDSFMKWYEALGLSKDQVSVFIGRYQLVIDYPNSKERILMLSDIAVKETLNKNTPQEVVNKVLSGEIATSKQIKEARKEELVSKEIEEAEILDNETISYDKVEKVLRKIESKLTKNVKFEVYKELKKVLKILTEGGKT